MSCEGIGVGGSGVVDDVGAGRVGGVGPVVFGLGVIVVRGAGAAGAWKGGEWGGGLSQITCGCLYDAVVVDRGDVGPGGRFGLGPEKVRSQKKRGGL